ncbi:PAS domain-containing protein [Dongia deserti]|uniref:PAS domain-containing protein n=1 Tax=Dongia deserti TaxID=2268030 RepID=UPI0013C51A36|nr:PAS domain S-box protein [Dongia deserti]
MTNILDASGQERRQDIERALHESEQQFRLLVENVVDYAIFMLDLNGRIVTWNGGAARIKGYSVDEVIGQDHARFYTEEDRASGLPALALKMAREQGRHETEGWRVRKDGSRFWANVMLEAAPSAMVMISAAGRIEMVNAQAEQVFGYSRQEMLGQPVEMLVPEQLCGRHPGLRGSFFADAKARPMGAGRDLFAWRKDCSEFPVEIGLNPIETDEGPMVFSAIVDISDRKQKESASKSRSGKRTCCWARCTIASRTTCRLFTACLTCNRRASRTAPRSICCGTARTGSAPWA